VNPEDVVQLGHLIGNANRILVLQPDKPDGDSVASALALEELLVGQGKTVSHYAAGRVEPYLSYLVGFDRVAGEWPTGGHDLAILLDCGSSSQVPRLLEAHKSDLVSKPYVLIDHHRVTEEPMAHVTLAIIDETAAATGQMVYAIAKQLGWQLTPVVCSYLTSSILADTLNLTNSKTTTAVVQAFADIVEQGQVNLNLLNMRFREATANDPDLVVLKGQLLSRLEFYADDQIALLTVDKDLIDQYRQRTSLAALVFFDMLNARGIKLAVVMSNYGAIIRTSMRAKLSVAGPIAEHFGGGGHDQAAAFPTTDMTMAELKPEFITYAARMLHAENNK
jgi:bifunctional oligoribonuclease and PAP phosphatase NrnA